MVRSAMAAGPVPAGPAAMVASRNTVHGTTCDCFLHCLPPEGLTNSVHLNAVNEVSNPHQSAVKPTDTGPPNPFFGGRSYLRNG